MSLPDRGTEDWFRHTKAVIVRETRAIDSFEVAQRAAKRLVTDWASLDDDLKSSLLSSIIISYSRPFLHAPAYPSRHLRKHQNFDRELHKHLLQLRNKLIAHSDEEYADGSVRQVMAKIEASGHQIVTPVMLHVRVTSLYSIHAIDLATRYSSHLDAALIGAYENLVATLANCFEASQNFEKQYEAHQSRNRYLPVPTSHLKVVSGQEKAHDLQPGLDEGMKIPPLTIGQDGYLYRKVEISHGPERKDITMPGGEIVTISRRPTT